MHCSLMAVQNFEFLFLTLLACSQAAPQASPSGKANDEPLEFIYAGRGEGNGRAQKQYYVSNKPAVWNEVYEACTSRYGGTMVSLDAEVESGVIKGIMFSHRLTRVWTGGAYDITVGQWIWTNTGFGNLNDLTIYFYDQRWRDGEPAISHDHSRLAITRIGFKTLWESREENEEYFGICEFS